MSNLPYTHLFQEILPDNFRALPWPSGSPTSSAIDLRPHGGRAAAVWLYSGWTDSSMVIEASPDGTGYAFMRNTGNNPVTITPPTAQMTAFMETPPEWYIAFGHPFVRLASISGTGSGIPQATARTVKMMLIKA